MKNATPAPLKKLLPSHRYLILMGSLIFIDLIFTLLYVVLSSNTAALAPAIGLSILFLGLANLAGCYVLIRPLKNLEKGDRKAIAKVTRRLQRLPALSALWIFCLTITYTIVNFSGEVFILDGLEEDSISLEKGLIAAFWFAGIYAIQFSFYAFFVATDCVIYARKWVADETSIVLRSANTPLRIRLIIGMGMIAVLPPSVIVLDVLYFNDVRALQGLSLDSAILLDSVATFMAALVSIVFITRSFTRPVAHLQSSMQDLALNQDQVRAAEMTDDELGELARRFNRLANELEEKARLRAMLYKFVNRDVVARLEAYGENDPKLKGELRIASVMFTDIEGFSKWSENISPSQLINVLNTYFSIISDIIRAHNGVILNYIGDSIYAVFNIPQDDPRHAQNAINCAIAIQTALQDVRFEGGIHLPTRFGINSGPVVAGVVGTNEHMEYSVYGDVVNVAARLEQLNKRFQSTILISTATARLAWDLNGDRLNFKDLGEHALRGKVGSYQVFSVLQKEDAASKRAASPIS